MNRDDLGTNVLMRSSQGMLPSARGLAEATAHDQEDNIRPIHFFLLVEIATLCRR